MNTQEEEKEQVEQVQPDKKFRGYTPGVYAQNKSFILIGLAVILILGGAITGGYFFGVKKNEPKACSLEAKICPDGSAVGRTGPNCEFSPCPTSSSKESNDTSNWKTYTNTTYGFSLKYPSDFFVSETFDPNGNITTTTISNYNKSEFSSGKKDPDDKDIFLLFISVKKNEKGLNEAISWYKNNKIEDFTLNGIIGARILNQDNTGGWPIIVVYNKNEYNFNLRPINSKFANYFDQILSTFKFKENNTEPSSQSKIKGKLINYSLPSGWQTVRDISGIFEVGYDSTKYNVYPSKVGIDLSSKACCSSIFFRLLPYDGSSRHEFIKNQGALKLPNTIEKEYIISGKSSLFQYGVDFSGSNTAGIVILNNSQALSISSQSSDQALIEQVLSTLKFIQ